MIRIAVAGYGYWGPKLARNIAEARECELAAICDPRMGRLVLVRHAHPGTHLTTEWQAVLGDPRIDVAPDAGEPEHLAYLTLRYPGPFIAHVHVCCVTPTKTRRVLIGGSRGSVSYDDLDPVEKVRV